MNTFHVYAHVYMYVGKALSKTYIFINVNIPWFCWGISIWNMPEIHLWTALLQAAAGFFPTAYFGFQDGKNRGGWCWSLKEEHFSDGLRETFPETLLRSSGWWFQIYFQNIHPEIWGFSWSNCDLRIFFFQMGGSNTTQRVPELRMALGLRGAQVRLMRSFHPSCRWERFERSGDAWRIIPGLTVVVNNQWRVYISPQGPWGYSISKWPNFMAEINGGVISDPNYLTTWGWSSKWWVDDGLPLWC